MITNSVNGKSYIGISVNEPEKDRIQKHLSGHGSRLLASAIKKYGKDVFTYEILEENVFPALLAELEIFCIAKFNTVTKNGYNLTSGGEGAGIMSNETRRKMSKSQSNRSVKHRQNISKANKGKTHTNETRCKLSEIGKGKRHSEETRRKIGEAHKGKIVSPEARKKISEAMQGRPTWNKGLRSPRYEVARNTFFALPESMPIEEKRKMLYTKHSETHRKTLWVWTNKWLKEGGK